MKKSENITLWVFQILLALLFLFTGGLKIILPIAALQAETPLPGFLIRLVGVFEILGALGLILPGIFKMDRYLTPLAAIGLIIIMICATAITIATTSVVLAILPIVVGLLCIWIARKRWPKIS